MTSLVVSITLRFPRESVWLNSFIAIQMLGVLRTPLRAQRPALYPCITLRQISTASSTFATLRTIQSMKGAAFSRPTPVSRRALSLGSIFGSRRPTPVPPPQVVAQIASLEAAADANPQDVEKQVALFTALMNTNVKAGYDVVVSRWERMCEFVSQHLDQWLYSS